jgi:hypothetical protein
LLRGGRYSKGPFIKLGWIWDVWGSGWPLLTGGRCSEVAISTGLTVYIIMKLKKKLNFPFNVHSLCFHHYKSQAKQMERQRGCSGPSSQSRTCTSFSCACPGIFRTHLNLLRNTFFLISDLVYFKSYFIKVIL